MEHLWYNADDWLFYHGNDLTQLTKSELIHLIQDWSLSWWYSVHEHYGIQRTKWGIEKKYNHDVLMLYEQLFIRRKYCEYAIIVQYLNNWNYQDANDQKKWIWCQMAQIANDICYLDQETPLNDFSTVMVDFFTEMNVIKTNVWWLYWMEVDYTPVHDIIDDLKVVIKKQSYKALFAYFKENYETFTYSLRAEEVSLLIEKIKWQFTEPYETIWLLNKLYEEIRDDEYNRYMIE
jgi:hypothetical protein